MKIVLIRHGTTVTNASKIFSLDSSPLSDIAYNELDALKPRLENYKNFKVYVSPVKRTIQTAQHLGFSNFEFDERIKEYNFGSFKGLTFDEAKAKYPSEADRWIKNNENEAPPNGETSKDHFKRVCAFLNELAKKNEDSIVITHYGTITMALAWALDNFDLRNKFAPKNSSLTILNVTEDYKLIECVNL